MSGKPETGEPALYNYQPVRYSHFDVEPGASLVLTSDPWSFLTAFLTTRIDKTRGENHKRYKRARYFAQLARAFCEAGDTLMFPSKGTLLYYGLLNLVKCFISVRGVDLEGGPEIHGLMPGDIGRHEVVIASQPRKAISIFHKFAGLLGTALPGTVTLGLAEILAHIPEIHEMAYALKALPSNRRSFLPVKIDFCVNADRTQLFTEIRYEKKQEARFGSINFLSGVRKSYFRSMSDKDGWVVFRSRKRKGLTRPNWSAVYANVCKEYRRFHLFSILTLDGYKYYCNLGDPQYHQLCYVMMFLFYIGTVSRYRPSETERLLTGQFAPLVTEAATMCPQQMLYQFVSMITKQICVKPHAMLR